MNLTRAMRSPFRFLAIKIRNSNGRHASLDASPTASREPRAPAASDAEAEPRQNETVWYVDPEVYQEIWDNEEDAVYDNLPTR